MIFYLTAQYTGVTCDMFCQLRYYFRGYKYSIWKMLIFLNWLLSNTNIYRASMLKRLYGSVASIDSGAADECCPARLRIAQIISRHQPSVFCRLLPPSPATANTNYWCMWSSILQSYLMSIICLENVFKVFINSIKYPIQIFCVTELGCFVTV